MGGPRVETPSLQGPELSRLVNIAELGAEERVLEIDVSPQERAALAARFALLSLDRLAATVRVKRVERSANIRLSARFVADVVQSCVATLEPVASTIEESVELLFAPLPQGASEANVFVSPTGEDTPEPLVGEEIDVGEVVAEHLALALDPYPRRPGAVAEFTDPDAEREGGAANGPFAALRDLKNAP